MNTLYKHYLLQKLGWLAVVAHASCIASLFDSRASLQLAVLAEGRHAKAGQLCSSWLEGLSQGSADALAQCLASKSKVLR